MKINYELTGQTRKSLVEALNIELQTESAYLGMPTANYQVGGYTVTKTGEVTGPDSRELVHALWSRHNFTAVSAEYDDLPITGDEKDGDDVLAIEMTLDGFTDDAVANLEKLIASKDGLIKKALGVEALPVEKTENMIRFPWFTPGIDPEVFIAYAWFITSLCNAAKTQKRVTATERQAASEKFAFRVFLIRLGFVGGDFKSMRKILLRNLSGSSSYAK